ncbi:MAG: hypothetical protein ACRYF4_06050 [Janthinobacterium lividum]
MLLSLRRAYLVLLLCCSIAGAQTLAHPGWHGNGIASEAWWKHAAFVRFDADTTFTKAAESMDAISAAGADSLILPDMLPTGLAQPDAAGATRPFDSKFGDEQDLDTLLREASARRMHVVLHADLLRLAGNAGELRFWMSRGIAGFDLGDVTPAQTDTLQLLRGAMDHFPGRRILLAHVPEISNKRLRGQDAVTLHLLSQQESAAGRGPASVAIEIHTADALKSPLPANTAVVINATLLQSETVCEDLRQALAARGHSHSPVRSGRHRSRKPS